MVQATSPARFRQFVEEPEEVTGHPPIFFLPGNHPHGRRTDWLETRPDYVYLLVALASAAPFALLFRRRRPAA